MIKLAVIGSAGRKDDASKMTLELYNSMYHLARLWTLRFPEQKVLVSGGAAFSDMLAVNLFLAGMGGLHLYLPAPFEDGKYVANGQRSDGSIANYYHEKFSEVIGRDSLATIQTAIEKGAITEVGDGFWDRNTKIAQATHLLAFTFGSKESEVFTPDMEGYRDSSIAGLKPGGTSHTWQESNKALTKTHINLNEIL